jgi:APA family basic amino acid/polyamine antiporter
MLVPFLPANSGSFGHFGWSGVLRGTVVAFSAYLGFDVIAALAPRSAQPARHFAIAIAIVLSLSAALYIATALVVTGIVPLPDLAAADPILRIIPAAGGALDWLGPWIAGGAILGLTSVLLSLLVAVPRMLSSLAREAGIGAFASDRNALFAVALGSAAVAGFCPIDRLAELISVSALLLFGGVAARAWQLGRGLVPLLSLAVTLLFLAVAPPAALAWTALSIAAGAAAGLVAAKVNMRALQRRAVAD